MKKRIKISESVLRKIVMESVKGILTEDKRVNQARNRSKQVIQNFFSGEQVDVDGILRQFEDVFYHDPQMRARGVMRLEPLFCRLALESGFGQKNPDNQKLGRLQQLMGFMHKLDVAKKTNLSKVNLDATYEMLEIEFGDELDNEKQAESDRINNTEYTTNNDYEIIGPVDYKTAHEYGNQSCPGSKLCYTQSENAWKLYTNNGYNNAYILLRKGWENIPPEHDDSSRSPYDMYGLSMIFVFVDDDGELAFCNTRWNHEANYTSEFPCDKAMNKEQVSELIGRRFDDVFKPGKNRFRDVARRLQNGESPEDVFDWVDDFHEGLAWVYLKGKGCNFINREGKVISQQWFNWVNDFHEGFAVIMLNGKFNFLAHDGKLLSQKWFDEAWSFEEGFAIVELDGKGYNFINQNGEILRPDQWFDWVEDFNKGFAMIKMPNYETKYIDSNGKLWDEKPNL